MKLRCDSVMVVAIKKLPTETLGIVKQGGEFVRTVNKKNGYNI